MSLTQSTPVSTEKTDHSTVLKLTDVVKEYGGSPPVRALNGVSFEVQRGELVAIEGTSGSGKSTLLNIIGTLDRPTSGFVEIDGRRVDHLSQAQISGLRAGQIGFVFQQFHLLESLSALDNVGNGLIYAGVDRKQRRAAAAVALERVGLSHRSHHRPGDLSGGERQRVAIARALIGQPTIVLADEPTGNLDSETSKRLIDLFRELHDQGATFLIITHDRELAASLPRQITIRDGLVVADTGRPATHEAQQSRTIDGLDTLVTESAPTLFEMSANRGAQRPSLEPWPPPQAADARSVT